MNPPPIATNSPQISSIPPQSLQTPPQPDPEQTQMAVDTAAFQKRQAAMKKEENRFTSPQISQAMNMIAPNSKAPQAKVGGALNTNNYSGLCLAYVDDVQGNNTSRQPTAYADYQANAQAGNIETKGTPPKGARVYFAPTPDNPAGHVGLSLGNGEFEGATTNQGIKTFSISNWEHYANQQYIGFAPPPKT